MGIELVVELSRRTLEMILSIGAPVLIIAMGVSLLVSILQVMTSIQDPIIATVPRLAAVAFSLMLMLPWILRRLVMFVEELFGDFHPYVS